MWCLFDELCDDLLIWSYGLIYDGQTIDEVYLYLLVYWWICDWKEWYEKVLCLMMDLGSDEIAENHAWNVHETSDIFLWSDSIGRC